MNKLVQAEGSVCTSHGDRLTWRAWLDGTLSREPGSDFPVPLPPEIMAEMIGIAPFSPVPHVLLRSGALYGCAGAAWKEKGFIMTTGPRALVRYADPQPPFAAACYFALPAPAFVAVDHQRVARSWRYLSGQTGQRVELAAGFPVPGDSPVVAVGGEPERRGGAWRTPPAVHLADRTTWCWSSGRWSRTW